MLIYFKQSRNGSYYIINGWIKILYITYIKSYDNKLFNKINKFMQIIFYVYQKWMNNY